MELPAFLQPQSSSSTDFIPSVFQHSKPLGSSKTIWWSNANPTAVVLFIPGNPGLAEFYIPFLSELYEHSSNICILAQSHLGHTEEAPAGETSLLAQIDAKIEALDALKRTYPDAKIIVIGHSVGSYIALQVLKSRPNEIDSLFLLFPTITHIRDTPNGHSLSWAFHPPLPYIISKLSLLLRLLPSMVISNLFHEWPEPQLQVLRRLLRSPSSIHACLSMAHDEMNTIRELDVDLLEAHKHRIHMFFAETDGWVGKNKDVILRSFDPDRGAIKIVHGNHGVPHAFCINHSQELADQCIRWMSEL